MKTVSLTFPFKGTKWGSVAAHALLAVLAAGCSAGSQMNAPTSNGAALDSAIEGKASNFEMSMGAADFSSDTTTTIAEKSAKNHPDSTTGGTTNSGGSTGGSG